MRVLVADNQHKVRNALRVLLEYQPGIDVVSEAADAGELLVRIEETCPDIVLLHWRLRGWSTADPSASSGQDLLCGLREAYPGLAVIVLSGHPEVEEAALAAGADAFVSKADPPEVLLDAIARVKREEGTTTASAATLADE
jgi:two-component system response regulator DesR